MVLVMLEVDCATEMGLAPARPISRIRNASPAPRDSTSRALSVLVSSAVLYFRPPLFWLHSHRFYLMVISMPVQCRWIHLGQLFIQWNLFLHSKLFRVLVHPMCPGICRRRMCWFVACFFFLLLFLPFFFFIFSQANHLFLSLSLRQWNIPESPGAG